MVNHMDIDPQHRKILQNAEKALTNSASEINEIKDHYDSELDNLSEDERESEEGEAIQKIVNDLEEICDRLDLTIIDISELLS